MGTVKDSTQRVVTANANDSIFKQNKFTVVGQCSISNAKLKLMRMR